MVRLARVMPPNRLLLLLILASLIYIAFRFTTADNVPQESPNTPPTLAQDIPDASCEVCGEPRCQGIGPWGAPRTRADVYREFGGDPMSWVRQLPDLQLYGCSNEWFYESPGGTPVTFKVPDDAWVDRLDVQPSKHVKAGKTVTSTDFYISWWPWK